MARRTRICFHCDSDRLELDPSPERVVFWCLDCGQVSTSLQVDPDGLALWGDCTECGQSMEDDDEGRAWHVRELVAPRCSIHRAELVEKRRRTMRIVG